MSCYRIARLIGVGGMGMVYEARWLLPYGESMPVACKVVRNDRRDIPHYREFMRQEAAIGMRLGHNHPNLVTVFDFFEDEQGRPCLAMELVQGGSVADLLDAYHRLPAAVVRRIAIKALSALACLHDAQVLHRDLSPCNILVSTVGEVKVSDLNLVKLMEHGQAHTHTFRGKPVYASPEAREHGPLDARSDLYSLGAILYHMLTGKPPCGDERDPDRILECSKREAFAPLPESTPRDLAELTMGLLRSQPDARKPQSAHEALELLHRSGEPIAGRAELGGLATTVMQRRESERRAGNMAQHEFLELLEPGDMLVARAIDVPAQVERAVDALPDVRPERAASSVAIEEHAHSIALAPSRPGTQSMDSLPPVQGNWASERSLDRHTLRFAALLVALVVAVAGAGALLYVWLPASEESTRLSTTSQPPAPAEPPAKGQEQRLADAPAPGPTLEHEAAQRERQAQPERHRQAPGKSSRSTTARRKPSSHVVPDAKIIEIE
jgi:serine/threonine protein kinase